MALVIIEIKFKIEYRCFKKGWQGQMHLPVIYYDFFIFYLQCIIHIVAIWYNLVAIRY